MTTPQTQATRPRVLVVDDASLVRLYCRQTLGAAGFHVEEALNGIEALEKVLAARWDLLVLDLNMPRLDGLALLHALRREAAPAGTTPVLMMSTEPASSAAAAARAAGANLYLEKPVPPERLRAAAAALTGWRQP